MPVPQLTSQERQVRLRNLLRNNPGDPLLEYLVLHQEKIARILKVCGDFDLILGTINKLEIPDRNGNQVTRPALRQSWTRILRVLSRVEQFDKIKDGP